MVEQVLEELAVALENALGTLIVRQARSHGELTIEIRPEDTLQVAAKLKDTPGLAFRQLSDLAGVDYLTYGQADWQTSAATTSGFSRAVGNVQAQTELVQDKRFGLAYQLLSVTHNRRLRVKVYLDGPVPKIDSVIEIWPAVSWFEREAFDLFGILFDGHPDLRRLLTDYGFIGHPFRKDFPLEGYVEVRYDPEKGRVVNQPVTIEPRTLVPRVIRDDDWLSSSKPEQDPADA